MKPISILALVVALFGIAASAPAATAAKAPRPNCKALLPIAKIEEVTGGAVTLEHFGKSDFIRNATTPGTEAGTECVPAAQARRRQPSLRPAHDNSGTGVPDVYYLYVFTPLHNTFSIDFLNGVTLKTEEGLARELSGRLDQEWRGLT
jgi:hypothetical protein